MKWLTPYLGASHDRLTGRSYIIHRDDINANVTIEHHLQVAKTELVSRKYYQELKILEYEYTAHSSLAHSLDVPVAKFHFEPSPMQVLLSEVPRSFSHFDLSPVGDGDEGTSGGGGGDGRGDAFEPWLL